MPGKRARQEAAAAAEAARRAQADTVPTDANTPELQPEQQPEPEKVIVRTFERPARIEAEQ